MIKWIVKYGGILLDALCDLMAEDYWTDEEINNSKKEAQEIKKNIGWE